MTTTSANLRQLDHDLRGDLSALLACVQVLRSTTTAPRDDPTADLETLARRMIARLPALTSAISDVEGGE